MKTEVHFLSTHFNIFKPRDYFINEGCFGDDLAQRLIVQLRSQGIATDDAPGQEDFGWYFHFQIERISHTFVVGFQPNDAVAGDQWIGTIERKRGMLGYLVGARHRGILPRAIEAIDLALKAIPEIRSVSWHEKE
ncbi:MAG TPA: hypothetical protein VMF06_14170 [Candidatus Limnocylindria bacterium]|nr:hypothetical protein [Candidatus Limnocylindria bacterium]